MEPVWTNRPIVNQPAKTPPFCPWPDGANKSGTFGMAPWLESNKTDSCYIETTKWRVLCFLPLLFVVFQSTSSTVQDFFHPQAQNFSRSRLSSQHSHAMQSMAIAMGVPQEMDS